MARRPRPADFSAADFRKALGRFPTGVTVITAENPVTTQPIGLTISSFSSVSLAPPMVLWTLTDNAASLAAFRQLDRYVIHVLSASQAALARRFAHGPQPARFGGVSLARAPSGTLRLGDGHCAAWFECFNVRQHRAGDHWIFIGQVEHCGHRQIAPLIYHAGDFDLTPTGTPL
ncbi:flavin reductase family protein [Castellaniella sp.]|uniref:flavin reductase family protein n=1 Tax=Castellaniella sp. TaxID=1955812 RepID=UPI00356B5754